MKNFFEHQDQARRNTGWLITLFAVAVVLIIAALYAVALGLEVYMSGAPVALWQPGLFVLVTAGGLAVMGVGSATKALALRGGGSVVAEQMGGRVVHPETTDPEERQLMNVVEEMAIASGIAVPTVYVLDKEDGINAFAAGFSPDNAVIGVTRGCMHLLTRDELQGVIAHEYSHILHGDMRINLRLIGILHGILLIGIIGRILMRSVYYGAGVRRSRDRDDDGKGRLVLLLGGLALFVIGSAGFFCGRLIKSAVSRQREFLADASAVQFTRNPDGLAGALKKIGGHDKGSKIESSKAEENSHLFFSYALGSGFLGRSFSTHPPLTERIRRLDSSFDGHYPEVDAAVSGVAYDEDVMGLQDGRGEGAGVGPQVAAGQVVDQVGLLSAAHLAQGEALRTAIPEVLRQAAHEPFDAVALTYGLLLDPDEEDVRAHQLAVLREEVPSAVFDTTQRLLPHLDGLDRRLRLPLLDMATPALRQLTPPQHAAFSNMARHLAEADQRLSIFEYALQKIIERRLARTDGQRARRSTPQEVEPAAVTLLAALARAGHYRDDEALHAFHAGLARLPNLSQSPSRYALPSVTHKDLDRALYRLAGLPPRSKQQVLDACAHCALADEAVQVQEAELLRAVAVALDCPLPPLMTGVAMPMKST